MKIPEKSILPHGLLHRLQVWIPALLVMGAIFFLSSQPSDNLPNFNLLDRLVKKGGHTLGYGLLALSYLYALGLEKKRYWLAWSLAILYALTDEFHQSFVPGRSPSIWDVILFDNSGALIALFLALSRKKPGTRRK